MFAENSNPENLVQFYCTSCNVKYDINHFIHNDKKLLTCKRCRDIKVDRKNFCHVCGIRSCFNFLGQKFGIACIKHKEFGMINVKNKLCVVCNKKCPSFSKPEEKTKTHCAECKEPGMITSDKKCIVCNSKRPSFNMPGEKKRTHCADCKESGMIIKHKLCVVCNKKEPSFNIPGQKPTHCATCKEPGMINIKNKKCILCNKKQPCFNKPGEIFGTHCASCKEIGMVNVKDRKCVVCAKKRPNFNKPGETKPTHCKDCKLPDMIDIKNKKCIVCKKKQPNFNKPEETKATHCADCKLPDMIDIKNKKCIVCKQKVPNFNKPGENKATHCADCKDYNMVNVKHKKCIVCNKKRPTFNKPGENKATHCGNCKISGMVDVLNKKCVVCNKKQAGFNKPGETIPTHCNGCKDPNMVNIKDKRCVICNKTQPIYGYIGQNLSHCGKCAKEINYQGLYLKPKTTCEDDCKEIATYGTTTPLHCEEHAKPDEICLITKKCKGCSRENMLLDKNDLCVTFCKPNSIYQQQKREKKKEKLVLNYLDKYIKIPPEIKIIDNECLAINLQDCNRRFPDRAYDCGTHIVIVEVDENQHRGYTKDDNCELKRMHQIYEVVGLPCIFLRFNPDNYRVQSKLQKTNMAIRLEILQKWVEKCLTMSTTKGIVYKFLYYNEYVETDIKFQELDDMMLV
jgi:hypothetical protein